MDVCCANGMSDADIEEQANIKHPSRISSPWHIRRHIEPVYCQCQQDANRFHVIMEC
jgi:hypothetical protein